MKRRGPKIWSEWGMQKNERVGREEVDNLLNNCAKKYIEGLEIEIENIRDS